MKTFLTSLVVAIGIPGWTLGDGIPVNEKGEVTVPHELLKLSATQTEEIETLGTLTLDPEQFEKLRAVGPSCPKRFEDVLPVSYRDCTCDMRPYAIQLSKDRVAVTHRNLEGEVAGTLKETLSERYHVWLHVDRRGQFYHRGVLIPFPHLMELTEASSGKARPGSIPGELCFAIHLPVGMKGTENALKTRLDKLLAAASKTGWNAYLLSPSRAD